jgi:hypothetical protein
MCVMCVYVCMYACIKPITFIGICVLCVLNPTLLYVIWHLPIKPNPSICHLPIKPIWHIWHLPIKPIGIPDADWDHSESEKYGLGKVRPVALYYKLFMIDPVWRVSTKLCPFVDSGIMHADFQPYLRKDGRGIDYRWACVCVWRTTCPISIFPYIYLSYCLLMLISYTSISITVF